MAGSSPMRRTSCSRIPGTWGREVATSARNGYSAVRRTSVRSSPRAAGTNPHPGWGVRVFVRSGFDGVAELLADVVELLPEGPAYYPREQRTDLPHEVQVAELIRERALQLTRDEVPHAVPVAREELADRVARATLFVETESQKQIMI